MGQVRLPLALFLGTLVNALVVDDPTSGQTVPAGFQKATLKTSLDGGGATGFGQMSPFPGAFPGSFPSGQNPLTGNWGNFPPPGTGPASGVPGTSFGNFPTGTGSASGVPSSGGTFGSFSRRTSSANSFLTGGSTAGGFPSTNFDPLRGSLPITSGQSPFSPFGPSSPNAPFSPAGPLTPNLPIGTSHVGGSQGRPNVVYVPVPVPATHDGHHHHHHDVPVKTDPHHHDVPVRVDPHHHDVPVKVDPHHHDVPVKVAPNGHHHDPHHHDIPVKVDPHHHDVPVKVAPHGHHHDPHHHDVPVNPHAADIPIDPFNVYSPSHRIGDLVPIGHHGHGGPPGFPTPPINGPECQFSDCSIGQECVIAKTIVTQSATLCPRAYSGRCVCMPGCVHEQKFIPNGYLKYAGKCKYCKCFPDGRVECKKSRACFRALRRDRQRNRILDRGHRPHRPRFGPPRRPIGTSLGGIINHFLGKILG